MNGSIEIYQSEDEQIVLDVSFEQETVWLSQEQMAELFDRDRTVISRHIRNIFKDGELAEEVVSANIAHTTPHGAITGKTQQKTKKIYNLDVIISVGYRVKSVRGTQFRKWATAKLKELLVEGYVINRQRLVQKEQEVKVLKSGIHILGRAIEQRAKEAGYNWLSTFAKGLGILDDFDHESLDRTGLTKGPPHYPALSEYYELIKAMHDEFDSDLFGLEKDATFQSSITQITKGIDDSDFYPSIEEKAAMLLYLITKNHSFVDGNKRIGAACFLLFLESNELLFLPDRTPIISNEALAALTLYIASSKPEEMETVKRLIISVLNRNQS
ncbi:MAG: RhuM family protein [Bacteroidota bacterium]